MSDRPPEHEERPTRPPGTLRIGRIAGADVLVNSSWFIVAALIAFLVSPRVEQVQPGLGSWKYVAGLAFAVLLYLAVLIHEASHALMAKRYGYRVTAITLHFLGGMTAIEGETRKARQEFWIAVVGPLTSIAIGLGAVGLWFVTPEGLARAGVEGLAAANLFIGVLNLSPGLPFDGGRVLRSAVWGMTGDQHFGSVVAAWGGRLIALGILSLPLVQAAVWGVRPTIIDFALVGILAAFLWAGATASLHHARLMARLPALAARPLARRTVAVAEDVPLAEAVRRAQEHQAGSIVILGEAGTPVGLVNESALLAVPLERRPWMPVSSVSRSLEPGLVLPADLAGEDLVRAIGRRPAEEYLLVETDGVILGVLATADVDHAFRRHAN